jgi:transposase-like protein
MARKPRYFKPEFKAQVVLDLLVTGKSLSQAGRELGIKDTVLSRWRSEFLERAPMLFERGTGPDPRDAQIGELERMLGRLTVELEMAKKVSSPIHSPHSRNGRS